jgi:hypothetical protein
MQSMEHALQVSFSYSNYVLCAFDFLCSRSCVQDGPTNAKHSTLPATAETHQGLSQASSSSIISSLLHSLKLKQACFISISRSNSRPVSYSLCYTRPNSNKHVSDCVIYIHSFAYVFMCVYLNSSHIESFVLSVLIYTQKKYMHATC